MPIYSVVSEVVETRAYQIDAESEDAARDLLASDFEYMEFDILNRELQTMDVEEVD